MINVLVLYLRLIDIDNSDGLEFDM